MSESRFLSINDGLLIDIYGDYKTSISVVKMPKSKLTSSTTIYNFTSAKEAIHELLSKTIKRDMKADYIETISKSDLATGETGKCTALKIYNEKTSVVFYGYGKTLLESNKSLLDLINFTSQIFIDEVMKINEDYSSSIEANHRDFIGRYNPCCGNGESFDIVYSNDKLINNNTKESITKDQFRAYVNMITNTSVCGPATVRTYKTVGMYYMTVYNVCSGFSVNGFGRSPYESIINVIDNMVLIKTLYNKPLPKRSDFKHHHPHRDKEELNFDSKYYTNNEDITFESFGEDDNTDSDSQPDVIQDRDF
jgi:hypothetical protein